RKRPAAYDDAVRVVPPHGRRRRAADGPFAWRTVPALARYAVYETLAAVALRRRRTGADCLQPGRLGGGRGGPSAVYRLPQTDGRVGRPQGEDQHELRGAPHRG